MLGSSLSSPTDRRDKRNCETDDFVATISARREEMGVDWMMEGNKGSRTDSGSSATAGAMDGEWTSSLKRM